MSDERDMPWPPRHELEAIADEIVAGVGGALETHDARRLRNRIYQALLCVRGEAARGWLGSALMRARGDD